MRLLLRITLSHPHFAMTHCPDPTSAPAGGLAIPPCPLDISHPEILAALAQGRNLVLSALPGAGKSSRVPLWLMDQPWLDGRRILLLEPRRVAARALARYMAGLLGEQPGGLVGYRMRDESRMGSNTRVEVVTEGVLTRMLQDTPDLPNIACVIFDEFHERSLIADTGLALCLESQAALRPDLRLIVMSATLDVAAVAELLGGCPSVLCEGKTYPVQMRHTPPTLRAGQMVGGAASTAGAGPLLWRHMADVIAHLMQTEQGSLLAFLPGAGEIRHLAALLEDKLAADVALCPLYGNLTAREQDAAIAPAPAGQRKVVLATSIAETSLTIEGVRLVVDSGLARLARFDPASGLSRLVTERVSLAGAAQRAGRAGRTEPGICCRLWAKEHEHGMRPHIRAEILDADLSGLALQLAVWGVTDASSLPWLDTPPAAHLTVAQNSLQTLGAIDAQLRPTALGREMAALPLAPRTARLLLWGRQNSLAALAACVAALLEERDPLAHAAGCRNGGGPAAGAGPTSGCDVLRRLDWLCRDATPGKGADAARERTRRLAQRLLRQMDQTRQSGWADSTCSPQSQQKLSDSMFSAALAKAANLGRLIAIAWPEQVAMRQPAGPQTTASNGLAPTTPFLLRSGRAAQLASDDPLARQPFLAVAEVDGAAPRGRIRLAAALAEQDLAELFSTDMRTQDTLSVSDTGLVSARRQRVLGALILEDAPLPRPLPDQCATALCEHVRNKGLDCLPWDDAARQWRARVSLMRELEGEAWPDVSDAALLGTLEEWLAPAFELALGQCQKQSRANSLATLTSGHLLDALRGLLPGNLHRVLERQAPTEWQVASGAMRPIVYGEDGGPWLAAKLQELFGCVDTPRIANNRVALVLRLNSPAGRPLQVTRDLANFWRNGYPAVRAEMRGRYPKHPWPEDPLSATATVLTKKRLAEQKKN